MKTSKNSSVKKSVSFVPEASVMLLTAIMLSQSMSGCAILKRNDGIETTPVRIEYFNNIEYWCLEKTDFTATLQEATRCP